MCVEQRPIFITITRYREMCHLINLYSYSAKYHEIYQCPRNTAKYRILNTIFSERDDKMHCLNVCVSSTIYTCVYNIFHINPYKSGIVVAGGLCKWRNVCVSKNFSKHFLCNFARLPCKMLRKGFENFLRIAGGVDAT